MFRTNNNFTIFFMRKYFILLLITSLVGNIYAQINIDSLEKEVNKIPNDSVANRKIITLARAFVGVDNEATLSILKILEKNNENNNNQKKLGQIFTNIANTHVLLSNTKEASAYYIKAKKIAENINDSSILTDIYLGLGALNIDNKIYDTAINLLQQGLMMCPVEEVSSKSALLANIGSAYFNLSQSNMEGNDLKLYPEKILFDKKILRKSIEYTSQALEIAKQLKSLPKQISRSGTLSQAYLYLGNLDSASFYFSFAENLLSQDPKPLSIANLNFVKGQLLDAKKNYQNAINAYTESLNAAKKVAMPVLVYEGYYSIAKDYEKMGNTISALAFYKKYMITKDSFINKENYAVAADIQNKYKREKKEKEIFQLNTTNKEKSILNKIFIGSTIGLSFLGFLGYRNFRAKRKLQQQKITELEKDKQLSAIDAMLQGQEEERSRIAKDLHDGLGGMLSGTKLSFINMKDNLVLTPENAVQFDKSLSMLDNTIADLRKVAHNLMPEALVKFGLDEAVKDFCSSIQSSSNLKVVYQQVGEKRKLTNTAEVFTYRIIQELVNNAVKHAGAKQIIVQLNINTHKLSITVEDDGKGFDINSIANSKGAGMDNIKYRVQYFNGTLDIVTAPGKGTSVNIELTA
jgi:two-component system, NarL family, sensor kinase